MSATVSRPPAPAGNDGSSYKRKRSRSGSPMSRDRSPPAHRSRRSQSPSSIQVDDADPVRKRERERQAAIRQADKGAGGEVEKPAFDAQAEFQKLINSRSGGVYMPPARLRALQAAASQDKSSVEYQRLSWDALRKSLTGIVNRVNVSNIKDVIPEMFQENLIRGRGLFARSIMKAQASSLPFTPVFAGVVAIINTKLPMVGELVLTRLISQFRRSFKRNDKVVCHATSTFIAHLVNQQVAHEIIALQMLVLLLERPTDDSVEIAVGFMREVGAYLAENSPKANNGVYERFRAVLHEGAIDKRVQYMIEVLFQVRKDKYKDNPIIPEGLDLVQEDDQITHQISLDDELQVQDGLNIFKPDPNFVENEQKYKEIKAEILGASDEESESGSESEEGDEDEDGDEPAEEKEGIEDLTGTAVTNLRRVIYLTIMNSLNYEEAVHKLMKINIQEGQEIELCNMVVECCSQERSYSNFYGLIGERFSKLNRVWCENFEEAFANYYETIHRYETNRLRNIARFFGHLLASDAISWAVFSVVKMNEDDTTSSSRIFVKIMMQEITEEMGLKKVTERFKDPTMKSNYEPMFPMDNPKNTRFSINYFTSIGLGAVTEEMREHLKNAPRLIMEQRRAAMEEESSSSDSDTSDTSSDTDSDTLAVAEALPLLATAEIDLLAPAHVGDVAAQGRGTAGVRPDATIGVVGPRPCPGQGLHLAGVLPDTPYQDVDHLRVVRHPLVEATIPHRVGPALLMVIPVAGTVQARALHLQLAAEVTRNEIGMMIDAADRRETRLPEGEGAIRGICQRVLRVEVAMTGSDVKIIAHLYYFPYSTIHVYIGV